MDEADILAWAVPAVLASVGVVFLVLHLHVRGALWWALAYFAAASGFVLTIIPVGQWQIAKAIFEDSLFLFAMMAMVRGISLRFHRPAHDAAILAFIALTGGAAAVALARFDSVPAEIFIIQSGCACLQLFAARQMWGKLGRPINAILFALSLLLAFNLLLQNAVYMILPSERLTIDGWRESEWAFAFQAGSALFGLLFAFTALIAIGLDAIDKLRKSSETDPLSGVLNRRGFEEQVVRTRRSRGGPSAVVLVDIDHFKQVNDGFGHSAGDMVIAGIGTLLSVFTEGRGAVGRLGGEEFAVYFGAATLAEASRFAESLRTALAETEWPAPLAGIRITASFGVAELFPDDTLGQALGRADQRLYRAKKEGRNRVVAADGERPLRAVA